MRSQKWTREPPSVEGWYKIRRCGQVVTRRVYDASESPWWPSGTLCVGMRFVSDIQRWDNPEWSGPIPEPDED